MGTLFGHNNELPAKDQLPLGMNANRSATHQEGRVLPLLYGRQRVGCQFISDAFDIKVEAVNTGGKQSTRAGTNYYASFAVAVCHGPVTKFHDLYLNGDPVFSSTTKIYAANLAQSNNVATFQTRSPHGLTTGDSVNIYNCEQPEFNGQFTVTVVSETQFQYTIPGTSIPSETATAVSGQKIYCTVKLDPIVAGSSDSTQITIPDFGTATIYWGTETQPADAYLSMSGIVHPPYKGICYIVFKQLFLGFNQTNVQNVEVVVERTPEFSWQADPSYSQISGDCNPAIIYADLLLNARYGLALADADVNTGDISSAITEFYNEGIGLSPLMTRPDEIRSQLMDCFGIVGAAPILDSNGLLSIILQRTVLTGKLTVSGADLSELPAFDPADWSGIVNETYLNFTDRDAGWVADFVTWKDTAGIFAKNRPEPQTLDKLFVTQKSLAQSLVNIAGQLGSVPKNHGKLQLVFDATKFSKLVPGAEFTFSYASRPFLNGQYRVLKRNWPDPAKPLFEIEVEQDRSYLFTDSYLPAPPEPHVGDTPPVPALTELSAANYRILELPAGLKPDSSIYIAALLQRDATSTNSAQIWLGRNYVFSGVAPESFFALATLTKFALAGALSADFLASAAYTTPTNTLPAEATDSPFPLVDGMQIELSGPDLVLPDGISDFDSLANTVLLFIGDEIMSISAAVLTGPHAYTLSVVRGRFGTTIADHIAGDSIWIIRRSDLIAFSHPHFVAGNTAKLKLTFDWQTVADVDALDFLV